MKIETMKTLQSLPQEILSLLSRVAFGVFLGLTGLFSVPCYAGGVDNEKYGLSQTPGKVFGGIVVHLQKMASTGDDRILIDLTPMTSKGVPVCQKPSGKLVSVLAGKSFRHHREPSSFVVIPDPSDPLPRHLAVGDCFTVDGNDVDRIPPSHSSAENSIRIVPSLSVGDKGIRIVRALSLKLWPENPFLSREAHTRHLLPKNAPAIFPTGNHRKA